MVAACRDSSKLIPQYSGEVRVGDLRDPDYLDRVLVGIDIICHAAGWSSFEKSGDQCNKAYLEPTIDLINRAIEWRVSRFVNLSSLYSPPARFRNNANSVGKPRRNWPMMNCHIAVEDYLRNYNQNSQRCQFINLRLGLYSGKGLNMGLLPLLLTRAEQTALPYVSGKLGHLPIIDGRDIGQAFARAALAPIDASYSSINICGPDSPSQADVMDFINEQIHSKPLSWGLPSMLAGPLLRLRGLTGQIQQQPLFTPAMVDLLKCPVINNQQASSLLGYDPEISWQASLLDTLDLYKNQLLNSDISQINRALNLN